MSDDDPRDGMSGCGTGRHFLVWCAVCWIAAAPSFLLGAIIGEMGATQLLAMAVGVFLFVVAYTRVSTSARFRRLRKRPFVERTLKIGYGLRLAQSSLSIVTPVAVVDMAVGMVSVLVTTWIFGGEFYDKGGASVLTFAAFLIATLIQGCLLNLILVVLMLVIYGLQRTFLKMPADPVQACGRCGYDLRASRDVCPECGEPIPSAGADPTAEARVRL